MAYRLSRSRHIIETLELTDDSGRVIKTIDVTIDVSVIAKEYRNLCEKLGSIERQLKAAQKSKNAEEFDRTCELYGETITTLLRLIFGEKNAQILLGYYENNYFEMSIKLVPFIFDVISPKIVEAVKAEKQQLAVQYRRGRKWR